MKRSTILTSMYPSVIKQAITAVLMAVLTIGMLASLAGPVAAQGALSDVVMQVEQFGPLLELTDRLFDISATIEG